MSKKVFCGGLPWAADDSDLEAALSHFGNVQEARVITDRDTGRSRGFGFVTFELDEDAAEACRVGEIEMTMDGRTRTVRIDHAEDKPRRDGGGGGGRGPRGRR